MLELRTRGVQDCRRLRRRVARIYGLGRITPEMFENLHSRIKELEELLLKAEEKSEEEALSGAARN